MRGAGEAAGLDLRAISTGRNVFVEYGGRTYEVGEALVGRLEREMRAEPGEDVDGVEDAQELGLDLPSWFPESDTREDSRVGDEDTTRVTGTLDLSAALRGLRRLADSPLGAADPALQELRSLGPKAIARIDRQVSDSRFALEAAKADGTLRRIAAEAKTDEGGTKGSMRFELVLSGVGEEQRIDAPSGGRPIGELLQQFDEDGGPAEAGSRELRTE